MPRRKILGLIVNPIAGMGGRVGLKGTDGTRIKEKAIRLGATKQSPSRAVEALQEIAEMKNEIELVTYPHEMGENEALECGFSPKVIGTADRNSTTAEDTKEAAREMADMDVDMILFAGGDGTARDICEAINQDVPTLGIPTGVKIHSSVFAVNPRKAGRLTVDYLRGDANLKTAEVMDIDEQAFRENRLSAELHGYLQIPYENRLVQPTKSGSSPGTDEESNKEGIAEYVVAEMNDSLYLLGPGTTVKAITDRMEIEKTLLGVDVVHEGKVLAKDVNENQILDIIEGRVAKIIVSPIGGQGFIFGRGNQQISPEVIRQVGRDNIIVIATKSKLSSRKPGEPLYVDSGDKDVDEMLGGYMRVITGYQEEAVVKVSR